MLRSLGLRHGCHLLPKAIDLAGHKIPWPALHKVALPRKCVLSLIDHYGYEIGTIFAEMFDFLLNQLHYARETLF